LHQGLARFDEGVVVLNIKIDKLDNASVSIYVGLNALSTSRDWTKWVGGTDRDIQVLTCFTSC
jgi:hypothetical protein